MPGLWCPHWSGAVAPQLGGSLIYPLWLLPGRSGSRTAEPSFARGSAVSWRRPSLPVPREETEQRGASCRSRDSGQQLRAVPWEWSIALSLQGRFPALLSQHPSVSSRPLHQHPGLSCWMGCGWTAEGGVTQDCGTCLHFPSPPIGKLCRDPRLCAVIAGVSACCAPGYIGRVYLPQCQAMPAHPAATCI